MQLGSEAPLATFTEPKLIAWLFGIARLVLEGQEERSPRRLVAHTHLGAVFECSLKQTWFLIFGGVIALLLSTAALGGQASLSWNPSADQSVAGYYVYYGTASRNYSNRQNVGRATSYTASNLTNGARYYFAVTAYNEAGQESSFSNEASALIPLPTGAPTASFSASATSGVAPVSVSFSSSSTGTISLYSWNFGDGTSSTAQNPTHVYSSPGTYSVSLTVTGSGGSNTMTRNGFIVVSASGSGVVANFSASRQAGPAPLNVSFTDESTGTVSSYNWSFGDGGTSTARNPSHTYSSPGTYTVSLTVTGSGGSKTVTKNGYIRVGIDNDLLVDFGAQYGIWQWLNNASWTQIHEVNAKGMVLADVDHSGQADQVIDFGTKYGIWMKMNNGNWTQLHWASANWMAQADVDANGQDDLVIDFGAEYGIWMYLNGSSWTQLHWASSKRIVVADVDHNGREDLVIDFGAEYGIWMYLNGTSWKHLDMRSASWMAKTDLDGNGQDDLVIAFGAGTGAKQAYPGKGVWAYMNGASWTQIDARAIASTQAISLDIDRNGREDLVVSYGSNGIWVFNNNTSWSKLHSVAAKSLVAADLDSNGQQDLVVDFGTQYGIHAYMNGASWNQLHQVTGGSIVAGQVDAR